MASDPIAGPSRRYFPAPFRVDSVRSFTPGPNFGSASRASTPGYLPPRYRSASVVSHRTRETEEQINREQRRQSALKLKLTWDQLFDKYGGIGLDEDDEVDLLTGRVVKDRGRIAKWVKRDFGEFSDDSSVSGTEGEGEVGTDVGTDVGTTLDSDEDELAADWEEEEIQEEPAPRPWTLDDETDLASFLRAEEERKEGDDLFEEERPPDSHQSLDPRHHGTRVYDDSEDLFESGSEDSESEDELLGVDNDAIRKTPACLSRSPSPIHDRLESRLVRAMTESITIRSEMAKRAVSVPAPTPAARLADLFTPPPERPPPQATLDDLFSPAPSPPPVPPRRVGKHPTLARSRPDNGKQRADERQLPARRRSPTPQSDDSAGGYYSAQESGSPVRSRSPSSSPPREVRKKSITQSHQAQNAQAGPSKFRTDFGESKGREHSREQKRAESSRPPLETRHKAGQSAGEFLALSRSEEHRSTSGRGSMITERPREISREQARRADARVGKATPRPEVIEIESDDETSTSSISPVIPRPGLKQRPAEEHSRAESSRPRKSTRAHRDELELGAQSAINHISESLGESPDPISWRPTGRHGAVEATGAESYRLLSRIPSGADEDTTIAETEATSKGQNEPLFMSASPEVETEDVVEPRQDISASNRGTIQAAQHDNTLVNLSATISTVSSNPALGDASTSTPATPVKGRGGRKKTPFVSPYTHPLPDADSVDPPPESERERYYSALHRLNTTTVRYCRMCRASSDALRVARSYYCRGRQNASWCVLAAEAGEEITPVRDRNRALKERKRAQTEALGGDDDGDYDDGDGDGEWSGRRRSGSVRARGGRMSIEAKKQRMSVVPTAPTIEAKCVTRATTESVQIQISASASMPTLADLFPNVRSNVVPPKTPSHGRVAAPPATPSSSTKRKRQVSQPLDDLSSPSLSPSPSPSPSPRLSSLPPSSPPRIPSSIPSSSPPVAALPTPSPSVETDSLTKHRVDSYSNRKPKPAHRLSFLSSSQIHLHSQSTQSTQPTPPPSTGDRSSSIASESGLLPRSILRVPSSSSLRGYASSDRLESLRGGSLSAKRTRFSLQPRSPTHDDVSFDDLVLPSDDWDESSSASPIFGRGRGGGQSTAGEITSSSPVAFSREMTVRAADVGFTLSGYTGRLPSHLLKALVPTYVSPGLSTPVAPVVPRNKTPTLGSSLRAAASGTSSPYRSSGSSKTENGTPSAGLMLPPPVPTRYTPTASTRKTASSPLESVPVKSKTSVIRRRMAASASSSSSDEDNEDDVDIDAPIVFRTALPLHVREKIARADSRARSRSRSMSVLPRSHDSRGEVGAIRDDDFRSSSRSRTGSNTSHTQRQHLPHPQYLQQQGLAHSRSVPTLGSAVKRGYHSVSSRLDSMSRSHSRSQSQAQAQAQSQSRPPSRIERELQKVAREMGDDAGLEWGMDEDVGEDEAREWREGSVVRRLHVL